MGNGIKKIITKFPYKNKIILTLEINILNLIILLFLSLFYDKVYFLKIQKYLKYQKFLSALKFFKLHWINYNEYDLQNVHAIKRLKGTLYCDKYSIYISKNIWNNSLKNIFLNKDLLANCLNNKIKKDVTSIYEVMEIALILQKKIK